MKYSILLAGALALSVVGTAQADPRAEVVAAFEKAMDDGSYRMHMSADTRKGKVESTMDVQWPDRFRMKTDGGEFIILPSGTWMNMGGQWMKSPVNMGQMIQGYTKDAMEQGVAAIQQVTLMGEERVQGCDAKHYSYSAKGEFMGVKSDAETEVWVCQDSGLPIQLKSNERGKKDVVTMVYDWDADIDIRAPN